LIAIRSSLENAILVICLSTWALCAFFIIFAAYFIPQDIQTLRQQMKERAELEARRAQGLDSGSNQPQLGVELNPRPSQ
jgi:hypothetical protein